MPKKKSQDQRLLLPQNQLPDNEVIAVDNKITSDKDASEE